MADISDMAELAEEFPAWGFDTRWVQANSGPDKRLIYAWPLDGGEPLIALDADEMRRKINNPGGAR